MAKAQLPVIMPGKRCIVSGRTGSGKSTLGCWLLRRSPGHWIILNPKWTRAYVGLPDANVVAYKGPADDNKIESSMMEHRFTVIEPQSGSGDWETLDSLIMHLHQNFSDVGLCIDELYSIHNNGRAGEGLLGWLTRGRELRQSFLGLTQRPSWLTQFLFSESDYIVGMSLAIEDDRKRLVKMTGRPSFEKKIEERHWRWYDVARDELRTFGPVPVNA